MSTRENIKGNYPELSKITIFTNEVLVELEVEETSGLLIPGEVASEGGFLTHKAFVLKAGDECKESIKNLRVGQKVQLRWTVDLDPMVDVSHTNKPNLRQNPNCKLFSFKQSFSKDQSFKKYPTALVHEWDIVGTIDK